jgi:hypothetical protein
LAEVNIQVSRVGIGKAIRYNPLWSYKIHNDTLPVELIKNRTLGWLKIFKKNTYLAEAIKHHTPGYSFGATAVESREVRRVPSVRSRTGAVRGVKGVRPIRLTDPVNRDVSVWNRGNSQEGW